MSAAAATKTSSKKRKADPTSDSSSLNISKFDQDAFNQEINYKPLTMEEIHLRIQGLCRRVPPVPSSGFNRQDGGTGTTCESGSTDKEKATTKKQKLPLSDAESRLPQPRRPCPYDKEELREWATALQTVIEEFHLLVVCVSPATYTWGSDRSGAADQNLGLLSTELLRSQEQINARVSPLLSNVLAPVVALLTDRTVTTKNDEGEEIKKNHFITAVEDPDYVDLSHIILARNAELLRQVVLANLDKLLKALKDYLSAQTKDSQHDARGFVY